MADGGEFEFIPGPDIRALRIVYRGFWDMDVMDRYKEALRQRAVAAGGKTPVTRILLDLRTCTVQSSAIVKSMGELIEVYAAQIEHYGVLLPESTLFALQIRKLMEGTSAIYLKTEEEAAAWLASPQH